MRYEFIKIEETTEGQMAYMLDTARGVVVVAPIEFMGEAPVERIRPKPAIRYRDVEEDAPVIPRRRVVRRPPVQVEEELSEETEEETVVEQPVVTRRPLPKKPVTMVPPHLRGVFIKPGKPGADTEHREV